MFLREIGLFRSYSVMKLRNSHCKMLVGGNAISYARLSLKAKGEQNNEINNT